MVILGAKLCQLGSDYKYLDLVLKTYTARPHSDLSLFRELQVDFC